MPELPKYQQAYETVGRILAEHLTGLLHITIESSRESPEPLKDGCKQEPFWCVYARGIRLTRPKSKPRDIVFASIRRSDGADQIELYNSATAEWIRSSVKELDLLENLQFVERTKSPSWNQNIH